MEPTVATQLSKSIILTKNQKYLVGGIVAVIVVLLSILTYQYVSFVNKPIKTEVKTDKTIHPTSELVKSTPLPTNVNPYLGWKDVEAKHLGIKFKIPSEWEIEEFYTPYTQTETGTDMVNIKKNGKILQFNLYSYISEFGNYGCFDDGVPEDESNVYKVKDLELVINNKKEIYSLCYFKESIMFSSLVIDNKLINEWDGIQFSGDPREDLETVKLMLGSITYVENPNIIKPTLILPTQTITPTITAKPNYTITYNTDAYKFEQYYYEEDYTGSNVPKEPNKNDTLVLFYMPATITDENGRDVSSKIVDRLCQNFVEEFPGGGANGASLCYQNGYMVAYTLVHTTDSSFRFKGLPQYFGNENPNYNVKFVTDFDKSINISNDFAAKPEGSFNGVVIDQSYNRLKNKSIDLYQVDTTNSTRTKIATTTTDQYGRFNFNGLTLDNDPFTTKGYDIDMPGMQVISSRVIDQDPGIGRRYILNNDQKYQNMRLMVSN